MGALRTERLLWQHLAPRLVGTWYRVENMAGNGLFDALGFYAGQTIIVELKIGSPNIEKLRPSQREVLYESLNRGGPAWCCFAHRGVVKWFNGVPTGDPVDPPFYRRGPLHE